jgi:hypothetical protein
MKNRLQTIGSASLLALALAGLAPAASQAQIINGDFQFGTRGWTESGEAGNFSTPAFIVGLYETVEPVVGFQFGLITDDDVYTETISQSFLVSSDGSELSFDYRFLTGEYNDPAFNPTAYAVLTPSAGVPVTLFSVSRDDLQAGGAGPLLPGAQYIDVETIGQSAWQHVYADLSAYAGQTVTLTFYVDNDGDPTFLLSSSLAIDNVSLWSRDRFRFPYNPGRR